MRTVPKVTKLEVRKPYILEVTFEDGEHRTIDMSNRLNGTVLEPLRDPALFAQAAIDPVWHTVAWPNGADLAPEFLYEERFRKRRAG